MAGFADAAPFAAGFHVGGEGAGGGEQAQAADTAVVDAFVFTGLEVRGEELDGREGGRAVDWNC